MEGHSRLVLLFISAMGLQLHLSLSATVIVDGVSQWRNPTVYIGDSIIFKHEYDYKLYIFQNRGAFNLCNFTRAALLTNPNSTYFTWHPSRPGFFYFSFNNGSAKACQEGQKLAIKVFSSLLSPESLPTSPKLSPVASPAPNSGGIVSSSPTYPWPFQPRESRSPSPTPTEILPAGSSLAPGRGGGIPFINSNPVPFPTGETDSATIRPVPTSQGQVVGLFTTQMALCFVAFMVVMLVLH